MSKVFCLCLKCGKVQVRTDIQETIKDPYLILDKKKSCYNCQTKTVMVATKNMDSLKKKLEENPNGKLDSYILKLVKG